MSVHEVAMDMSKNLGYLSWYDAGMRVVRFGESGIEEVGHYIAEGGNEPHVAATARPEIAGSPSWRGVVVDYGGSPGRRTA